MRRLIQALAFAVLLQATGVYAVTVFIDTGNALITCPQTSMPIVYEVSTGNVYVDCTVLFSDSFE